MAFCGDVSKFCIIGSVLQTLAFVLHIIGFASPYWIYSKESRGPASLQVNAGLWQSCNTVSGAGQDVTTCTDISIAPDWFKAVQAFACLGLISLLIAVVALAVKRCMDKALLFYLSAGLTFAGAVCILISIAVYAAKYTNTVADVHFHFAFAFCIIAMILAIPAGFFIIIEASK
ncbi:uncharacterized protein LOC134260144 isoform X2 [Saccostrea cucullata]|uniref:uncharacterized protein LOC134260144 isoform X2 n=1 Tax=Saccostrea cuccullata TaxID=36930 RepID=UPI002ED2B66F